MRGTIRKIANEELFKMPATIEDVSSIHHIKEVTHKWKKLRTKAKL